MALPGLLEATNAWTRRHVTVERDPTSALGRYRIVDPSWPGEIDMSRDFLDEIGRGKHDPEAHLSPDGQALRFEFTNARSVYIFKGCPDLYTVRFGLLCGSRSAC